MWDQITRRWNELLCTQVKEAYHVKNHVTLVWGHLVIIMMIISLSTPRLTEKRKQLMMA